MKETAYSSRERGWLWLVAGVGMVGVNGAFLVGLSDPGALTAALGNPISAAFMAEALILMALMAYLLPKWHVARLGWPWLIVLSLLGGLAFAIPVVILWRRPRSARGDPVATPLEDADTVR